MADDMINEYRPDYVSPPGETLEELLEDRAMSQAELAERMGRPKKTINEIIQGKAALTSETALQLEHVLGIPASFWLTREQHYREFLARQQEEQVLATQVDWLNEVPVRDMIRAGWITDQRNRIEQLREVLRFFAIASPAQYACAQATYRRTQAFRSDPTAIAAWLRQGERLAQELECAPYDERQFRSTLPRIRSLTCDPFTEAREQLTKLCSTVGVAVVIVPEIPHTCVCGATRWLTPTKALIQLSLRYKTDDQFWFTFFHEAGHIILHGKRDTFLDEENRDDNEQEREANQFARDILIPPAELHRFLNQWSRYISKDAVSRFANEIGIAPGIVVGRLQFDNALPPTHLNALKRRLV